MTKAEWKVFYRLMRIARRENAKAALDMLCWGTGYIKIGPDMPDFIQHVPIEDVVWV